MKDFLKELLAYSHHTNQKMIEVFASQQLTEKSLRLMCHIINAQRLWNLRILPGPVPVGVWDMHPVVELFRLDKENFEYSLHVLQTTNLEASINYTTTDGKPFKSLAKDIFFHVVNHSTHHRAQIASDMRNLGLAPFPSDFIFSKREPQE